MPMISIYLPFYKSLILNDLKNNPLLIFPNSGQRFYES